MMEGLLSELHEELKLAFATYLKEVEQFEDKGVKVAATRARRALNELSKLITARRKEIQEKKINT
jgi:predicted secreted Zn-dependent protease